MNEVVVFFDSMKKLDRVSLAKKYLFKFMVVDRAFWGMPEQGSKTQEHYVIIGITDSLWAIWEKNSTTFNTPADQEKVIVEIARREIDQRIKEGPLPEEFAIDKGSYDYSTPNNQCPYDPALIADFGTPFVVTVPNRPIGFKAE